MQSAAPTSNLHMPTGVHDHGSIALPEGPTNQSSVCTVALLGVLFCLGQPASAQTVTSVLPADQRPTEVTGSSRPAAPPRMEVPLSENAWDFDRSHDIPGFGPMTAQEFEDVLRGHQLVSRL